MPLVKLKGKGQVTIPADIRASLNLEEGDLLEAELEGGRIVLIPKVLVDRDALFARLADLGEDLAERLGDEELQRRIDTAAAEVRTDR